eukprot:3384818-Prymnesium_polylepis.1
MRKEPSFFPASLRRHTRSRMYDRGDPSATARQRLAPLRETRRRAPRQHTRGAPRPTIATSADPPRCLRACLRRPRCSAGCRRCSAG